MKQRYLDALYNKVLAEYSLSQNISPPCQRLHYNTTSPAPNIYEAKLWIQDRNLVSQHFPKNTTVPSLKTTTMLYINFFWRFSVCPDNSSIQGVDWSQQICPAFKLVTLCFSDSMSKSIFRNTVWIEQVNFQKYRMNWASQKEVWCVKNDGMLSCQIAAGISNLLTTIYMRRGGVGSILLQSSKNLMIFFWNINGSIFIKFSLGFHNKRFSSDLISWIGTNTMCCAFVSFWGQHPVFFNSWQFLEWWSGNTTKLNWSFEQYTITNKTIKKRWFTSLSFWATPCLQRCSSNTLKRHRGLYRTTLHYMGLHMTT